MCWIVKKVEEVDVSKIDVAAVVTTTGNSSR